MPPCLLTLQYLKELDLSENLIDVLPEEFGDLSRLVKLNLSRNLLVGLPQSLKNMKQLAIFDASHNSLARIQGPFGLGFLQISLSLFLTLSSSESHDTPPPFQNCRRSARIADSLAQRKFADLRAVL